MKHVNDLLQRVIFDALANDEYTVEEIRENVDVAIERAEEYLAETDEENPVATDEQRARLEHLRGQIRAECISYGELAELQGLAPYIDPGDVELLEAAGVPEHDEQEEETG